MPGAQRTPISEYSPRIDSDGAGMKFAQGAAECCKEPYLQKRWGIRDGIRDVAVYFAFRAASSSAVHRAAWREPRRAT
jgi:hypothetical protein